MNVLWDLLSAAAAERGDEPFLTDLRNGSVLSYAELLRRSASVGGWLTAQGVSAGDRVAYVTKNDPAFFSLLLGCASVGAALVPINADNDAEETAAVLEDCGPKVILADRAGPDGWIPREEGLFEPASPVEAVPCPGEQAAILIYTSGTTGRSKGVVLSHKSLSTMGATLASVYGYSPGMRILSMLPYYHINAPVVTGIACLVGRSHVFATDVYGFTNARLILPYAEQHRLQVLSLTPSIMASLLKFNAQGTDCDLSSVAFGLVGTAHLDESLWRRFEETFGFPCYQGYGLTETTTWATMTPPDERKRYDSAGLPIGCEVRIDEKAGGEILIRGDIVMNGYHNRKALTRKQFKEDWFRSGDIGRIDEDGQLLITGRIKNIIKRKGILISPEEIDDVIRKSPDATDACTIGIPDELFGERVLSACVVDEARMEALQAHTRGHLSPYKYPDEFLVVGEIPKTRMGKPDLARLRRIATGEQAAQVVKSFDAYKFRRARSEDMPAIEQMVHRALLGATTLDVVGFWGVGSRDHAARPDVVALDRLKLLMDTIAGAADRDLVSLTLILADVHARCNQVPAAVYEPYFEAIGGLAGERGMRTTWLSEAWSAHDLDFEDVLARMTRNDCLEEWEAFPLREDFLRQAARRCGDEALAEDYAYRYFLTITTENPAVAASFPDHVFFTYNGPEFRVALPALPTLHLHSLKPGTAAKPWFVDS